MISCINENCNKSTIENFFNFLEAHGHGKLVLSTGYTFLLQKSIEGGGQYNALKHKDTH